MATLLFLNGIEENKTFTLHDHKPNIIGRNAGCDILIKETVISGQHARIERQNDAWTITDLGSSNGTTIEGDDVQTAPLSHDTLILFGAEIKARFLDDHAAAKPATPARPASPHAAVPAASADELALVEQMKKNTDLIRKEVGKVIIGQTEVLDQVLMVLLAGGHGLLVGMPGMAKTLMVSTIARVLDMDFKRIQFTPDLMPTDMTGTEILQTNRVTNEKEFQFIKGPMFCNLLLADEINRTPPKTQAALLEAMQEKRVTVGNTTYPLDKPFFVLATQNPIEQEGTYPLPEAQLDRFMFNIWVDYPLEHEEEQIVKATTVTQTAEPQKVLNKQDLLQLQDVVRKIPVSTHVIKYAIRLVRATRPNDPKSPDFIKQYVATGAGPRAGQFLVLAAKARAVSEGRIHVSCNDIRLAAGPVLRHRLLTNFAADSEGLSSMALVERLLTTIEEPDEKDYT